MKEELVTHDTVYRYVQKCPLLLLQGDTKKRELLKNPTKIEEIQEKKFIGRN
jgi:hypothetical protein